MDYEHGLEVVKKLAQSASWYEEVLLYEASLLSNLRDEQLYGPAPQTTQERQRVVGQLNRLCMQHLSISFNDLCRDIKPTHPTLPTQLTQAFGATLCLYAEADALFYQKLKIALGHWQHQDKINWLEANPGDSIATVQQRHLRQANLILLLCSADFFAAPDCDAAMVAALQEKTRRQVMVVPILVRACAWEESPCSHLHILPGNKLPISEWSHPDQAYDTIRNSLIRLSPRSLSSF